MSLCQKITLDHETLPHKCEQYVIPIKWLKANCRNFYFTDDEILAEALPIVHDGCLCGIYFLIKNNKIMYVGQSKYINMRIGQHRDACREFDAVAWFEAPELFLNDIEAYYINRIEPEWNRTSPICNLYAKYVAEMLSLEEAQ